jgi:hypothetical protein
LTATVVELIVMPFADTIAVELKSPVLGLYNSLVLPVYIVDTEPDVALANSGYRLVDVLVSLDSATVLEPHEVFDPSVVRNLPELLVWLGTNALKAALAVICPVPPAAIGRVPAARADELVEYSALLALVNVVKPVPP